MRAIVMRQELQAALIFASDDETRLDINSVHIETLPRKRPLVIATDGKRISVIESDALQELNGEEIENDIAHSFAINSGVVKSLVALSKAIGAKLFPLICLENKPGSKRLEATLIGREVTLSIDDGGLINGTYPEWRQVIPPKHIERSPVSEIALSAEYAADYAKAAKALESKTSAMNMNLIGKDAGIEVKIGQIDKFYSLIMPIRIEERINFQPDFLSRIAA